MFPSTYISISLHSSTTHMCYEFINLHTSPKFPKPHPLTLIDVDNVKADAVIHHFQLDKYDSSCSNLELCAKVSPPPRDCHFARTGDVVSSWVRLFGALFEEPAPEKCNTGRWTWKPLHHLLRDVYIQTKI